MTLEPSLEVRFFLFARVVGLRGLPDLDIPRFLSIHLESLAETIRGKSRNLLSPPTIAPWEDGILLVFAAAGDAGRMALHLLEWPGADLPPDPGSPPPVTLHLLLHAGPVFCGTHPVTGHLAYLGSHLGRVPAIPSASAGDTVHASREFAALAELEEEGSRSFRCVPLGMADSRHGHGRLPVYRLERTSQPDQAPNS